MVIAKAVPCPLSGTHLANRLVGKPEAILDRAERPHRGNRFDMAAKGADGLPLGEVEA